MLSILKRDSIGKWSAYIFISVLFIFILNLTWLKWGNLYTDTFHDSWVVEEMLHGRVLYRDIFYEYGLFAPYFLAGLCSIFGYCLNVFIFCGIALTVACIFFIYRICRLFVERSAAVLAAAIFIVAFVPGQYPYQSAFDFILPYSFASIFLVLFSLAGLFCFLKFTFTKKSVYLNLWVLSVALVFLSRPVMGTMIYLGFIFPFAVYIAKGFFPGRSKAIGVMFLPVFIAAAAYLLFLFFANAWGGFDEGVVRQLAARSGNGDGGYVVRTMGLDHMWFNLIAAVSLFCVTCICVVLLALAIRLFAERKYFIFGLLAFAAALAGGLFFLTNMSQYCYLPLMSGFLALWFAGRIIVGGDIGRYGSLCALFSLGFFMALRVILSANPAGAGFCFLAGVLTGGYIFFFRIAGDFFSMRIKQFSLRLFNIFLIIFFIFIGSYYPITSWAVLSKRTLPIACPRGTLIADNDKMAQVFNDVVVYLREHTDKNATVTAVPEISGINFFSQRRNPLRYYAFTRSAIVFFNEENVISDFKAKRPDYVVVLSKLSRRDGLFGVHYGVKLNTWIGDNYQLENEWPGSLKILKRKGS